LEIKEEKSIIKDIEFYLFGAANGDDEQRRVAILPPRDLDTNSKPRTLGKIKATTFRNLEQRQAKI